MLVVIILVSCMTNIVSMIMIVLYYMSCLCMCVVSIIIMLACGMMHDDDGCDIHHTHAIDDACKFDDVDDVDSDDDNDCVRDCGIDDEVDCNYEDTCDADNDDIGCGCVCDVMIIMVWLMSRVSVVFHIECDRGVHACADDGDHDCECVHIVHVDCDC